MRTERVEEDALASSVVVIVPARYASSRLPGKSLADIGGSPMVAHVLSRARRASGVARVLVATDDERIVHAVEEVGGEAVMTRADHPSGTDRIAEVARGLDADVVVNVQGDLPFLDPAFVESAVSALGAAGGNAPVMATLATPLLAGEATRDQVVKVVCDRSGRALYFSRSPIPWGGGPGLRHIGLYAYRREFLLRLATLEPTPLERAERLEQLRVLEHGHAIQVAQVQTDESMIEVDTPEDLERVRHWLAVRPELGLPAREHDV
ncbi:MAG: 3-deoxy-manno-octulosonate cytidylyltransferase [Deltaproteobacteria bacterium]|nr:3-deoxy-manno-octulosonate cytidylyltransferase [Deltaproteobacteria bacterium]